MLKPKLRCLRGPLFNSDRVKGAQVMMHYGR